MSVHFFNQTRKRRVVPPPPPHHRPHTHLFQSHLNKSHCWHITRHVDVCVCFPECPPMILWWEAQREKERVREKKTVVGKLTLRNNKRNDIESQREKLLLWLRRVWRRQNLPPPLAVVVLLELIYKLRCDTVTFLRKTNKLHEDRLLSWTLLNWKKKRKKNYHLSRLSASPHGNF